MAENAVPESRPGAEEQHVSPVDLRRWRLHRKLLTFLLVGRQRLVECFVCQAEGRCGIGAAAAEAGGDRDSLRQARLPAGWDAYGCRQPLERVANERVLGKTGDM